MTFSHLFKRTLFNVPLLWALCFVARDTDHLGLAVAAFLLACAMITYKLSGLAIAAARAGFFQRFPDASLVVASFAPLVAVWVTVLRAPTLS